MEPTDGLLVAGAKSNDGAVSETQMTYLLHNKCDDIIEPQQSNSIKNISIKNKFLGIFCCIICIISWVSNAHFVKSFGQEYNKIFFIMFAACVAYNVLFIPWYCMNISSRGNSIASAFWGKFKTLFIPASILALINLFVGVTWAESVNQTMVSINTAIYQSGVALVYILSVIFLNAKIEMLKIFGVILCVAGVITVSFAAYSEEMEDADEITSNSMTGLVILGISVFLNSVMMVGIEYLSTKYFDENKESQDMIFLQGFMGVIILFLYWPIFFVFDATNIEKFEWPSSNDQWIFVMIIASVNLGFFGGYFMGIVLTNAMFVSVIVLFVLPVGYFSDVIIYEYIPSVWAYVGTALIIIGFLIMELPIRDWCNAMMPAKVANEA